MKLATVILCFLVTFSPTTALAESQVYRISTSYKSLLSNPEQEGMLDEIVKEAFRRIGLQAEIVFTPTERSLADVNAGLLDGEINRIEGMETNFPNLVRVPEPNMTMHFVAFARNNYEISDWQSIRNLNIGLVSGWKILENITEGFPNVIHTPTETELFRMLSLGRIDIALYSKLSGYEHIKLNGYNDIHHLEPSLESKDMFLYMHKKNAELVEPLAESLRSMKEDGTYARIVRKATENFN